MAHNTILVDGIPSSKHPLYGTWANMRQRCYDRNHKDYSLYGARGIGVCERWLNSFKAFVEDMGVRPERMTLDRIDSDKNYSPDNCRWADATTQGRNQRKRRTGFKKGAYKNSNTGHAGVYLLPNGRYRAFPCIDGKMVSRGCYTTIEEAIEAIKKS